MNRNQLISELLGLENESSYIAHILKQTYQDLKQHRHLVSTGQPYLPIWGHDPEAELFDLDNLLISIRLVYSWYATDSID